MGIINPSPASADRWSAAIVASAWLVVWLSFPQALRAESIEHELPNGLRIQGSVTPEVYQLYGVNDRREWQVRLTLTNATSHNIVFGDDLILIESDETASTLKGVYHSRGRSAPTGGARMTSESPWADRYSLTNFDHQWSDGSAQGYCEGGTYSMRDIADDSRQTDPALLTFGRVAPGASTDISANLLQGAWLRFEHVASLRIALPELVVDSSGQRERFRAVVYFSRPDADNETWTVARVEFVPLRFEELRTRLVTPEQNVVTRVFAANWMADVDPEAAASVIAEVARSAVSGHVLGACLSIMATRNDLGPGPDLIRHAGALVADPETPSAVAEAASALLESVGEPIPDTAVPSTSRDDRPVGEEEPQRMTGSGSSALRTDAPESEAAPDREPPVQEATPLQARHLTHLKTEGYLPEIDEDGDIRFKREGFTYYIIVDETDPEYFRILFPSIWIVEEPDQQHRVLDACSRVDRETKIAKAYLSGDRVNLSVELLLPDLDDIPTVFPRCMRILALARETFLDEMSAE